MKRRVVRMRTSLKSLSVALAAVGLTALAATPSSAASAITVPAQASPASETVTPLATWKYAYYGNNWARVDIDYTVRVPVDVYNGHNNGKDVYVDVDQVDGGKYRHWDRTYDQYAERVYYGEVYRIRVCESGSGCSPWTYA